jgi:polynucleotide 5'-hydroxyl-kinase GRC3/NOL9
MPEHAVIPTPWQTALDDITRRRASIVLVLGGVDVGKSTFCRLVLAASGSHRVALVDADPGQKQIGPPAAVTLAVSPAMARVARIAFVGDTSPVRRFAQLADGAARLVAQAKETAAADLVLIDTDGMLGPVGLRLKRALLAQLRPDVVVAIERRGELAPLLLDHGRPGGPAVFRLPAAAAGRRKSDAARASARRAAFAAYFADASVQRIALAAVSPTPDDPSGLVPGRLCGLVDAQGEGLGLGLVDAPDCGDGTAALLSPADCRRAATLLPGDLRLAPDGRELERLR